MKIQFRQTFFAVLIGSVAAGAQAAKLEDTVSKAVLTNPSVLDKWHQFSASGYERDVSWGRYLPTLDMVFGRGHENNESPLLTPGNHDYSIDSRRITLRQNVFEGFATEQDVKRLEHASVVRFYELLDVSENTAMEATKAYVDVYRYRRLLEMAENNYAVHRLVLDKIDKRAKSGVGTGVDLELAAGRLALAESNLLTETSNLHDVTARYQRIVGDQPQGELDPPPLDLLKNPPNSRTEAIEAGFKTSPQLKAAAENILSAQRNVAVQRAPFYPRVDLYAESARDRNAGGVLGITKTNTVGLTVKINLFQGRQDSSRIGEAVEETNIAKDTRESVCRALRQNLAVAYNDYLRLTEQLPLLDQHQLSTDKTREAFRRQFEIGQRTLLDVLDTENEFYTASRDYVNGETDRVIAQAKYLAASGNLLKTLKLQHLEAEPPHPRTALDEDAQNICPPEAPTYIEPKKVVAAKDGDYLVLLENPDGGTGKVIIKGDKGEQIIETAGYQIPLDGSGAATPVSEDKMKRDFAETMAARPPLPVHYQLYFQNNSATLTAESAALLPKFIEAIANHPVSEVSIIGFTDTVGSTAFNQALGLKRANFVAKQIGVRKLKVHTLAIESRGESELIVPTPDETPEQLNRTVKITVR